MNKFKRIKGKVLPFAVVLSAWLFVPTTGMIAAHASVQNVQQDETITGTVIDNTGEAVIGASVIVVGAQTTTGTVTDFDGNFTLKVKPGTQLKISFVGYNSQEVRAEQGQRIVLTEDTQVLDDVVEESVKNSSGNPMMDVSGIIVAPRSGNGSWGIEFREAVKKERRHGGSIKVSNMAFGYLNGSKKFSRFKITYNPDSDHVTVSK